MSAGASRDESHVCLLLRRRPLAYHSPAPPYPAAELYQDMVITPQRAAALRPQRQRQRTAAEAAAAALGLLDECVHSLDYVDFVEALHRRMPLRCGWMYANAIMPTAAEWDRIFGPQVRRGGVGARGGLCSAAVAGEPQSGSELQCSRSGVLDSRVRYACPVNLTHACKCLCCRRRGG